MKTQELSLVYKWARIALIVLALFLGVSTLHGLKTLRDTPIAYNSITVSGEAEAFAVPDLATFSFTMSADKNTALAAQEEVTKKMDEALNLLKELGIEDKDIKTTDYSIYPKYTFVPAICTEFLCPPGRQVQDGYSASHTVMVKVRDTELVGEALASLGKSSASNVSNVSFTIDEPDKLIQEVRSMAIKEAKSKAEAIAKDLGVGLVRVVSFSDFDNGQMPYYGYGLGGDVAMESKAPTLPTGENKVKVVVNVTYEIR